ncbi:conserved Plasmodium protein, unknown function [Plasmodium chabaudi chabaudi]|uniref:Uncharacterized protein n=1 Tax=Plasmodium chabaudi chabaudi TaxID=31271 RepID=A0A4V0K6M5_PLACU|nr:conserved Plasmodium protein, unknown function [Plasmodium chabaudi chabaudi]VTZ68288.1 conserved Plasmodium protein, unknown function [Plasmodium chabaudi chabaudi]|eukprot:XP_739749.2 conserved Plasmodium protein, unknown function [Plasmodium chabaudi chabaudi]
MNNNMQTSDKNVMENDNLNIENEASKLLDLKTTGNYGVMGLGKDDNLSIANTNIRDGDIQMDLDFLEIEKELDLLNDENYKKILEGNNNNNNVNTTTNVNGTTIEAGNCSISNFAGDENMIESLCINELKSEEDDHLFSDRNYADKDELISMLRKKLKFKIKDYNLIMDTLIRTKEECSKKTDQIKELQTNNSKIEKECFELKKELEKKSSQSNLNIENHSFYKKEYDEMKYKLVICEDKYKEALKKNELLNKEITNLKNEQIKFEINKKNDIEKFKLEEEKLKDENEKLKSKGTLLINKYLEAEKKAYVIEQKYKEEIQNLKTILNKEEINKKNSVQNFAKVKDILSQSLAKSEESYKQVVQAEKERDNLKIQNENLQNTINDLNGKIDNLKNSIKTFENKYKEIIKKNNNMFAITHEFINQKNCKIIILRKNAEIKDVFEKYKIDKSIFQSINDFSALYIYEILLQNSSKIDETEMSEFEPGAYDPNENDDKYIKIKKKKYITLNYMLNEAQIKIITLTKTKEHYEKLYSSGKSSSYKDDDSIYKKHYLSSDMTNLYNEKIHYENKLVEKIEHIKNLENKLKEKESVIEKSMETSMRLRLEKDTLVKVISATPEFISTAHQNNTNFSIQAFVEHTVIEYVQKHERQKRGAGNMLTSAVIDEYNQQTPSCISNNSGGIKLSHTEEYNQRNLMSNLAINNANERKMKKKDFSNTTYNGNEEGHTHNNLDNTNYNNKEDGSLTDDYYYSPSSYAIEQIMANLEKAIVEIENTQIAYFRSNNLLTYIDDYMLTLQIFNRISDYNDAYKVEHLLEDDEYRFIIEKACKHANNKDENFLASYPSEDSKIGVIITELEKCKKDYSDEELLRLFEETKLLEKYRKFYHDHFVNINNIFNKFISLNLFNVETKHKNVYERYFNLFNLNFSNVEISFDLLLKRFYKILRLSKTYESLIIERDKKIADINNAQINLYNDKQGLQTNVELITKEKEYLEKLIVKKENNVKEINEKYFQLEKEYNEYKNNNSLILEQYENMKKENYNLEQELSKKELKNNSLNEKNCEIISFYEKEKACLQTLLHESKDVNMYLKEKMETLLNNNERMKYDYDIRLNNLNALWMEEKENNKKFNFNVNSLKKENSNLLIKIKEMQAKNQLLKVELSERMKQLNMFKTSINAPKNSKDTSSLVGYPLSNVNTAVSNNGIIGDDLSVGGEKKRVPNMEYLDGDQNSNYFLNIDVTACKIEYEEKIKKLEENITDLNAEILKLKGEKEILLISIETWRCFSSDSKEEINHLKKICNEQVEKHKEFILINKTNEDKLKFVKNLLICEKDKYEKDVDNIKEKLTAELEKVSNELKEKTLEIEKIKLENEKLLLKTQAIDNGKNDEINMKRKEEEYVELLKKEKENVEKKFENTSEKYNEQISINKKLTDDINLLISTHKEQLKNLNEQINILKKDNKYLSDNLEKEVDGTDNGIIKKRLEQLVEINKDLHKEIQENCNNTEKMKFKIIELKENIRVQKETHLQQQKCIIELRAKLVDTNMANQKDEYVSNLKINLESSRMQLKDLCDQLEKGNLNEKKSNMKIQMLETKLIKEEQERKRYQMELANKNNTDSISYNKLKTEVEMVTEENKILLLRKECYEKEIEQLKRDSQFFNSTKNNDMNIIERDALKKQVEEHIAKINEKDKQIVNLNFEIKKLSNQLEETKERMSRMESATSVLDGPIDETSSVNVDNPKTSQDNQVSLEIYKYINENIDLTAELENKNDIIEQMKEELNNKNMELAKLNKDVINLSTNYDKLKESIYMMEKHKTSLNEYIKQKDEIINSLQQKNNSPTKCCNLIENNSTNKSMANDDDSNSPNKYKINLNDNNSKDIEEKIMGMEEIMNTSCEEVINTLKKIPRTSAESDNNNLTPSDDREFSVSSDHITLIKCNILKMFKLGSCYLYIINRNLKEIKILKDKINSLEDNIQSLNLFINNLKDQNKNNEVIKINNEEQILQLKNSLQNNENCINNLNDNLKQKDEMNNSNIKNLIKYKNFIINLVHQTNVFLHIFKTMNTQQVIQNSEYNQLTQLRKELDPYLNDSIMISELESKEKSDEANANNDLLNIASTFSYENYEHIQIFTNKYNLIIERGQVSIFSDGKIKAPQNEQTSTFFSNISSYFHNSNQYNNTSNSKDASENTPESPKDSQHQTYQEKENEEESVRNDNGQMYSVDGDGTDEEDYRDDLEAVEHDEDVEDEEREERDERVEHDEDDDHDEHEERDEHDELDEYDDHADHVEHVESEEDEERDEHDELEEYDDHADHIEHDEHDEDDEKSKADGDTEVDEDILSNNKEKENQDVESYNEYNNDREEYENVSDSEKDEERSSIDNNYDEDHHDENETLQRYEENVIVENVDNLGEKELLPSNVESNVFENNYTSNDVNGNGIVPEVSEQNKVLDADPITNINYENITTDININTSNMQNEENISPPFSNKLENNNNTFVNGTTCSYMSEYEFNFFDKNDHPKMKEAKKRKYHSDSEIVKQNNNNKTGYTKKKIRKIDHSYKFNNGDIPTEVVENQIQQNINFNHVDNNYTNQLFNNYYEEQKNKYELLENINKINQTYNSNNLDAPNDERNDNENGNNSLMKSDKESQNENKDDKASDSCYVISSDDDAEVKDYDEEEDEAGEDDEDDEIDEEEDDDVKDYDEDESNEEIDEGEEEEDEADYEQFDSKGEINSSVADEGEETNSDDPDKDMIDYDEMDNANGNENRNEEDSEVERDDSESERDESDVDRDESDIDREESDIDRDESDIDRDESDVDRDESDIDRDESDIGRDESDVDRDESDIGHEEDDGRSNSNSYSTSNYSNENNKNKEPVISIATSDDGQDDGTNED